MRLNKSTLKKNTSQKALKHKIYIILLTSFILMKRNRSKKEPFEAALFRYCSQELSFRHLDQTERNQIQTTRARWPPKRVS